MVENLYVNRNTNLGIYFDMKNNEEYIKAEEADEEIIKAINIVRDYCRTHEEFEDCRKCVLGDGIHNCGCSSPFMSKIRKRGNNMLPNNPWTVCLEVQKYLQSKYNIDFITSRKKIFPLAKKLKDEDHDSIETMSEKLYLLYKKEYGLMNNQKEFIIDKIENTGYNPHCCCSGIV